MTPSAHHHEVPTAGQCEIDMRYDELVPMADNVVTYRYVMKMVAHKMGMMATFMPKPIFGDNASGMHVHQSLWTKGKNMMYDPKDEYAEISQTCRYYIGGLMDHARSLCAFTNPTTNSYRRLVPGYEAPCSLPGRNAIGARTSGFPCTTRESRRRSASSIARRTRPATRTYRSPRCCAPAWTVSRGRSIPGTLSTRTFTISARASGRNTGSASCPAP